MDLSSDVVDGVGDLHDKFYYINKILSFSRNFKAFKSLQREYLLNNKNGALLYSFYIDFYGIISKVVYSYSTHLCGC